MANLLSYADLDTVRDLVSTGWSDAEIANHFSQKYSCRGFSERSIRRIRAHDLNLNKRNPLPDNEVDEALLMAISETGPLTGRRYIKGYLRASFPDINISDKRIAASLKRVAPLAVRQRKETASRRINPKPYVAHYFGENVHYDQNEKLVMYGVTHVACIDGYSGYIVGHATMPVKNPITIYDVLYRPIVEKYGMWDQVIVDGGLEFVLINSVQDSLRAHRSNTNKLPFLRLKSTDNNRIERFWPEVNYRVNYPIKNAFNEAVGTGLVNLTNPLEEYCTSFVGCQISAVGIRRLVAARNHHHVDGRGKPCDLVANAGTYPLNVHLLPTTDEAVAEYRANGGQLTEPHGVGHDPLGADAAKIATRANLVAQFRLTPDDIYGLVANDSYDSLLDYLKNYVDITRQLM